MATVLSLIERVREYVGDYGDGVTTLTGALSDSATTVTVGSADSPIDTNSWLVVDNESLRVLTATVATNTITFLRAQRGTTAATHASGAVVVVGQLFTPQRIVDALNEALGSAYPRLYSLVDNTTLTVLDSVFEYTLPATYGRVVRVEVENSDNTSQYNAIRTWDMKDAVTLRIYGQYTIGANIRVLGIDDFTAMTLGGSLDTDYPTDQNALDYLVYQATASLLLQRQIEMARRDAFIGMTDPFGENQPNTTLVAYREAKTRAAEFLDKAASRMPHIQEMLPLPSRRYLTRN